MVSFNSCYKKTLHITAHCKRTLTSENIFFSMFYLYVFEIFIIENTSTKNKNYKNTVNYLWAVR